MNLYYQLWIPSYSVSTSISEALYGANEFIEEQNTIAENELREKVGLLKSLTIDIGDEVKGHNQLLQETDNTFDRFVHYILGLTYHSAILLCTNKFTAIIVDFSVGGLLSSTIGKVKVLGQSGSRYYLIYLLLFCFFVFIVLWLVI